MLVSKDSIGYLMSGLKGNRMVQEIDIGESGLDDEDLQKVCSRLMEESGLISLRMGYNQFSNF